MKNIFVFILLFAMVQLNAQQSNSDFTQVKELGGIEEYLFVPNDLNILLMEDHSSPVVTFQITYRVGSKNEVLGTTGATHLLEHLMFKGTPTFNKKNGNPIFLVLQNIGAKMNATTWKDRTNYYETIPSDKLELAIQIESDRMRNSLLRQQDKEAEMTVVRNEFERGENNPSKVLGKEIWAAAYQAHPYHHSTIGWLSDIENVPNEKLKAFYDTYYWPNNATISIIGDFQKKEAFSLIKKYFGVIPRSPHDIPQPYTQEPTQYGPRKVVVKKAGQLGVVQVAYKIPGRLHGDLPALTVLASALSSGQSSILNKTFIDTNIGVGASAGASRFQDVGLFIFSVILAAESNHDEVEGHIHEIVENIKKEGVSPEVVARVIKKITTQDIMARDGSGAVASALNEAIAAGDWADYVNGIERINQVTPEDLKMVAEKYFLEDQSTTGYFIPKASKKNNASAKKNSNFSKKSGKAYYRNPDIYDRGSIEIDMTTVQEEAGEKARMLGGDSNAIVGRDVDRKSVQGIDVISMKTGAKEFVTLTGSLPAGSHHAGVDHGVIARLTASMLNKGTVQNDKYQFSEKLEELGINLDFMASKHKVGFGTKCLSKDVGEVIKLMAEALRHPLFDESEFEKLKTQNINQMKRALDNPDKLATIELSQILYPVGHPSYSVDIAQAIDATKNATLQEVKDFYKKYYGPGQMHLVAVGDINAVDLYENIDREFDGWTGGIKSTDIKISGLKPMAQTKVITLEQKPSASVVIAQYTGLKKGDPDYLPFFVGTFALGGGFSGRLMQTVRDNEGLTYGISARHSEDVFTGGHWICKATFNPTLVEKGLSSTFVQINKWLDQGITQQELDAKKNNLIGSFKVGLSTTGGLARNVLAFVERSWSPNYLDQYPKDIEGITLDQVNKSIKKYLDPEKMIIIKAGSIDENGDPLKN